MGESGTDLDLAQLRGNLDLLLRAQRLGKTGYVVSDVKADRVYWSDSLFEQRKIPRRPFFTIAEGRECIHPDDLAGFTTKREQALKDGLPFEHEMRIICGDGSIIWERGQSQPQFDAQGNFTGLLSVIDDITEAKNATASLIEQEATYRSLFNSIGDAIFLTQDGVFIDCNKIALEMFGATREQMIGSSPARYSPERQPDGRLSSEKSAAMIARALAGERHSFEWRHMRQDGSEFDAEVTLNRVEGSTESYFFGVVRDISERKKAEEALKASHDKFAGAFNSSADAMIVLATGPDPGTGVILEANDSVKKIFARDRSELIGRRILDAGAFIDPKDIAEVRRILIDEGSARAVPIRIERPDGKVIEAEVSGAQFESGGGRLSIITIRDVSERHEQDRRIRELNGELAANLRQLRAIADNLPVGISQTDTQGRILFLNKTLERWLATDIATARGKTAAELFKPEYIAATRPMREAFAAGIPRAEQVIPMPDGQTRIVESTNIPDVDAAGIKHGNFGLVMDVTERKTAEAELRASHEKFASAFEYSTDAMVVSTVGAEVWDGAILDINRSAERMFGLSREELVGRTFAELRGRMTAFPLDDFRRAVVTDGSVRDLAVDIPRADGSMINVLVSGARFHLGDRPHTLTVIRDVSAARRAELKIHELNESLEKSVHQLRAIADNLPVAISYHDAERRFLFMNRTMEKWFATTEAQMLGRPVDDVVSDEYKRQLAKVRERFAKGEYHYEMALPYPDGLTRDVDVSFVPEKDEEGRTAGFYTLAIDISERKRAEQELKASHDKFFSAFEFSTDAMIVAEYTDDIWLGTIVEVNRSGEQLLGRPREQIVGRSAREFQSGIDAQTLRAFSEGIENDGHVRDLPIQRQMPSGNIAHLLASGSRFKVGDKHFILGIFRNVTDERKAEQRIRELNGTLEENLRLLRAIADNLPVAITYQDANGRFLFTNKTAETWFATGEGGMLGKTVRELVSQAYLDSLGPIRERITAGHSKIEGTVPYPDGKTRVVEATVVHDKNPDGSPRGRYTLLIDLTERKMQEDQLQQSQKMQAVGKLTGGVAHDFNNLLAVISGNLDLAAETLGNTNKRVSRLLEPARRAAERGSTLTRSLLAFSRQQPLSPQVTDLNSLVRDMTELLRRTMPSNIGIEFVGAAGLWACEVDPGQLQNALLNLVVNARDAMPEGGRLTIETRNTRIDSDYAAIHADLTPGQYVMLAVSDTGTGMPPDVVAHAFEPFFTTKDLGRGTGLGLSMVYGFAKQSGGHVAIYSEVGSGTTVKVYLPRWAGQVDAPAPRVERSELAARSETVLVVEDDEDMRFVAVTMLRSLGYTVLDTSTGPKALDLLARHDDIALLVTDVILAGNMNGRVLAEEAQRRVPGIKVLYMSGYTEDAIVHHGRLDLGVHFIQKPFRKPDLAAKVREALETPVK
jgi:PAS domain S-box-containing protein